MSPSPPRSPTVATRILTRSLSRRESPSTAPRIPPVTRPPSAVPTISPTVLPRTPGQGPQVVPQVLDGPPHVRRVVQQPAEHQSTLQCPYEDARRRPRIHAGIELAAPHPLLDHAADQPQPVRRGPLRPLLERRVGVVGLHRRVEQRAAPRHRRILDQPPELVDDRQQTPERPLLSLQRRAQTLAHEAGRVVEGRERQLLLAREVAVDAAFLEPRLPDQVRHRGPRVAPRVEHGRRPLHYVPPGPLAFFRGHTPLPSRLGF